MQRSAKQSGRRNGHSELEIGGANWCQLFVNIWKSIGKDNFCVKSVDPLGLWVLSLLWPLMAPEQAAFARRSLREMFGGSSPISLEDDFHTRH